MAKISGSQYSWSGNKSLSERKKKKDEDAGSTVRKTSGSSVSATRNNKRLSGSQYSVRDLNPQHYIQQSRSYSSGGGRGSSATEQYKRTANERLNQTYLNNSRRKQSGSQYSITSNQRRLTEDRQAQQERYNQRSMAQRTKAKPTNSMLDSTSARYGTGKPDELSPKNTLAGIASGAVGGASKYDPKTDTGKVVKGTLKDIGYSHLKTFEDMAGGRGSYHFLESPERMEQEQQAHEQRYKKISAGQAEAQQELQDVKAGATGLKKTWLDAVESGTGMLADRALGPAWAYSMFSRTYGSVRGTAEAQGATANEDRINAILQAGKEVATEYLFRGIGLARGLSGSRSLSFGDRIASAATRNLTGRKADIVGGLLRYGSGIAEENAEEAIAWGVEPFLEELAYKRNVRKRQAQERLQAESDELRSMITSPQEAEAIAAYLGSDDFIEKNAQTYMDNGMPEAEARALAESMRDYLTASLTGDTETMEAIDDDIIRSVAGGMDRKAWDVNELIDTFAATTLLTGLTGAPGAVQTQAVGSQVKQEYGNDGLRALANTVMYSTGDTEMSVKAQEMRDRLDSGKEITATQAYDLAQGFQQMMKEDSQRQRDATAAAQEQIRSENLTAPAVTQNGQTAYGEVTGVRTNSFKRSATDTIEILQDDRAKENNVDTQNESYQLERKSELENGAQAIANFRTGVFTIADANTIISSETIKEAFREETGIDLNQYNVLDKKGNLDYGKTAAKMKDALFAQAASNMVESAKMETDNWRDNVKGQIVTDSMRSVGKNGQDALENILKDFDERDAVTYMNTVNAATSLWSAGRNMGIEWSDVRNDAVRAFPSVDESILEKMYNMGLEDRALAESKAVGRQTEIGKVIESGEESTNKDLGTVSVQEGLQVKGSTIEMFRILAKNMNIQIQLVDHIGTGENASRIRGAYVDGVMYLNVNADNLGYVFMHEITHHMRIYAPTEYQALAEAVREKWYKTNPAQMAARIAEVQSLYANAEGQTLSEEEALEEIICDAAHEFLTDKDFADRVSEDNPSLAKQILNGIREALRALRRIFVVRTNAEARQNDALFSQLGMLKEAEELWLNAYTAAVRNRAISGLIKAEMDRNNNENVQDRFALEKNVERVRDLVAVHNLKADDMRNAFKLGGFPMPSIAVIKSNMGHDMYGDISLMFHSNTIDPKRNRANNIFGGDAYTPTFPQIYYKADSAVSKKLVDMYYNMSKSLGYDEMRPLYPYAVTIDSTLDSAGGESGLIDRAKNDYSLMRLYLRMNNKDVEDVTITTSTTLSDGEVQTYDFLIKELGKDLIAESTAPSGRNGLEHFRSWREANADKLDAAYEKLCRDVFGFDEATIAQVMSDEKGKRQSISKLIQQTKKYIKNGKTTTSSKVDYAATDRAVKEAADANGYDSWVEDLFKGIEEKSGIRNTRDVFTPSGNRRSWDSLHNPVTLDNVVDSMKRELDAGGNTLFGANPAAAAQKKYTSLDDVRADEDRLQQLEEEEYEALRSEATAKLSKVAYDIYNNSPAVHSEFEMFGAIDVGSDIAEILNKTRARNGIKSMLERNYSYTVSEKIMDDLMDAIDSIANIPTGYFEAKPKRAVELSEVQAAIIPNNLDSDVAEALKNRGIKTFEYDPNVEGDRTKVLNNAAEERNLRFSISPEVRAELNEGGIDVTEGGSVVRYSYRSWMDTDQAALRQRLIEAGNGNWTAEDVDAWLDNVNSVSAIIADDMGRLNYSADENQNALKSNSEYYYTLDLSTLCQKRRLYQGTYNAIMKRLDKLNGDYYLKPNDTIRLRNLMDKKGYEVPCGICYEESRKKNEGKFANTWLNGETQKDFQKRMKTYANSLAKYRQNLDEYNALEDKEGVKPPREPKKPVRYLGYANTEHEDPYIPTLNDVVTTDGRERMRKEHPEALDDYLEYQKGRGSANPKVSFTHTDYRGDILRMTDSEIAKVKHIGGLRIQSFSDFETVHVIDMMQAVMDMASKNLTAQAYTKVPAFADIFGGTGIKINLSLIGHVENGKLVFDAKEGINPDEAFRLREKYSKNVGTIIVGANVESILAAWADPRIDMVIPFHRSGWSKAEFKNLGLGAYQDFQNFQSERYLDGSKNGISLADAKKAGLIDNADQLYVRDYWDSNLSGKENAEKYLRLCAEQKRRPVFYNLLQDNGDGSWSLKKDGSTDGYWKSLIDYKMYDNEGNAAPQEEVKPNFDMEAAKRTMDAYEGDADTLPVADGVVDEFIKDYKKRYKIKDSDNIRRSLPPDLAKRDTDYMTAVQSGNMEEAQRMVDEAAKAAGYELKGYHGTTLPTTRYDDLGYGNETDYENKRLPFTKFKPGLSGGIYVASVRDYADAISKRFNQKPGTVFSLYAKFNNPLVVNEHVYESVPRYYAIPTPSVMKQDGYTQETLATEEISKYAQEHGYDGVIIEGVREGGDIYTDDYIAFHPNALKSADPVTYDDNGNVIPLSERFNTNSPDIRYSIAAEDSEGNALSEGQREFFANSKAVDDKGRLLVMYHNTPEEFTVFDRDRLGDNTGYENTSYGFFVTDYAPFANRFGDESFALYAKIINPIRHPEGAWRKYSPEECDEIVRTWLIATENEEVLSEIEESVSEGDAETIYDAWTDMYGLGEDPYEYASYERDSLEDAGYDAVEIFEGTESELSDDGSGSNRPVTTYAVFHPDQLKLVDNQNPSVDPDIRFALSTEEGKQAYANENVEDMDLMELSDPILEEGRRRMAKSKEEFFANCRLLWNEKWLTDGNVLKPESIKKSVRSVIMGAMSNSDTNRKYKSELVDYTIDEAMRAYRAMKQQNFDEAYDILWKAADHMTENVEFFHDDPYFEDYKGLRDYFRTLRLTVPDEYKADIDYPAYKKNTFGRIRIVAEGGLHIDEIWEELSTWWPMWFDQDVADPAQMLLDVQDALERAKPYKIAYSSEEAAELTGQIADDLYKIVYDGESYQSVADQYKQRYDEKVKALKQRHAEAMKEAREQAKKEKRAAVKEAREKQVAKQKERTGHAKYFGRIYKNYRKLSRMLIDPTQNHHIPEQFRIVLAETLSVFDMQTVRSKDKEARESLYFRQDMKSQKTLQLHKIRAELMKIASEDGSEYLEADESLFEQMDELANRVDGKTIDALTSEDLKTIDNMLRYIIHGINNWDKIRINGQKMQAAQFGDNTIAAMQDRINQFGMRKVYGGARGIADNLLNEGETTPIYFFERLDPTGTGIGAMYKELRRGEDKYIQNMNVIKSFVRENFEQYWKKGKPGSGELQKWRSAESSKTFNFTSGPVTLTQAQMMSLYLYRKREQAMQHITGNGIVIAPVTIGQKLSEKIKGHTEETISKKLSAADVDTIIGALSDEQRALADKLQSFLNNEMSAWGNETSMELYGYKKFRETDYFPIKSSNEVLSKDVNKAGSAQEKIKNLGFTKDLVKGANNAIVIDDVFTVWADHCNKMALYNAMSVPISDFMRVYNYKQTSEDGSTTTVQQMIAQAFTRKANSYIMKLLDDINQNTKTREDAVDAVIKKSLANYKKASIGANVRVLLQQPTAIFRAFAVIDAKYFTNLRPVAEGVLPFASRWNATYAAELEEMYTHCPIALWKSWGHYEMDLGRDIDSIIMNEDWTRWDYLSMGAYGALDNMTWCTIWNAVKNEIKANNPNVAEGSEEFWRLCNERASEVFDKTQVVDSLFHRSDTMRSKNTLTKMMTSFMAEPTLTYNVFRNSAVNAYEQLRMGDYAGAAKTFGRMSIVLILNAAAVSASAAIADVLRDKKPKDNDKFGQFIMGLIKGDDEDDATKAEIWLWNFLMNFADNANMLNNIYFVKDIWSLKDGWGTSNMALEGWETLLTGLGQFKKKITGESDKKSWSDILITIGSGIGYITGVPVKTVTRDVPAFWGVVKSVAHELFGIDLSINVFAADGTEEADKEDPAIKALLINGGLGSLTSKKKKESSGSKSASSSGGSTSSSGKSKPSKASSNVGDEEDDETLPEVDYEKLQSKAIEKAEGLSGREKDDKIWDTISEGYTKHLENNDWSHIQRLRDITIEAGGDPNKFDERITDACHSMYKRTINTDSAMESIPGQIMMREYMREHGVSDEEISEMCYKSNTAKDLKAALRIGDDKLIYAELSTLIVAGLSYEDFCKLYEYRNYGAKKYDGKYKDLMKSSGTYVWPTQGTITSEYGRRTAPTAGASTNHLGIDIGASMGSRVDAADGGQVIYAGYNGGYGNQVVIRHDDGTETYYSHLYGYNVKPGDVIAQGQQIGQVGSTGTSTGPHLDFRVKVNGEFVNPIDYLSA